MGIVTVRPVCAPETAPTPVNCGLESPTAL